jgi:2,3-bisphosphoglycerate-dependent phosphoglycerate mutase
LELIFVRHALPLRIERLEGPADPPLAPRGWEQAARLAEHLRHEEVHGIVVSPSRRTRETAIPLAEALGVEPLVDDDLAEFDRDATSYVPFEELRELRDERWEALSRGEYHTGIDPVAFRERIVGGVEAIIAAHPGQRIVVSTNAGIINAYVGEVLGQTRSLWFNPGYASITRVAASRDGKRGVLSLNETGHVRDLLRPR